VSASIEGALYLTPSPDSASHPIYADKFRCIGSDCEDTCCHGWSVPIDEPTWDKYRRLPESPLSVLINASVVRKPEAAEAESSAPGKSKPIFAVIRMDGANQCPMLSQDRLCRIQSELGEDLLSHACATFPRYIHAAGDLKEKSLTLSCPEAARLVLLDPNLLTDGFSIPDRSSTPDGSPTPESVSSTASRHGDPAPQLARGTSDQPAEEPAPALPENFWPIRTIVLNLLRNRLYPLWQRLFLIGVLCRRLDAISSGELKLEVPAFLNDFEASLASGALRPAMETVPLDRGAQLDLVLRLAGMMLRHSKVTPRFAACVKAFTAGIGNGPGATFESLTAQYILAHDSCYAPFVQSHPHIMENFLANTLLRCQFPFGREAMKTGAQPAMVHEFALLTAQFALMRGLLIGVAGHHGAEFSESHVVHTVQAASKHFEHHPEFLSMVHALLVERSMDSARGLAILLRNVEEKANEGEARPASPERSAPAPEGGRSAGGNSAPAQDRTLQDTTHPE
jgi:lysine-N-methylase